MTLKRHDKRSVSEHIQRNLVHATVGFKQVAELTYQPSLETLAAIFDAVQGWLKVTFDVRVVETA